jgi:nucleoside-diphosphate-sugar epimerase
MILVTGATGLLGSHVVMQLVNRGERPRVLARSVPQRSFLATLPEGKVDFRSVDLESEAALETVLDGITAVVHCAALASPRPEDAAAMKRVNVGGTRRLFEAAARGGISAWVQVSSVATLCDGEGTGLRSEADIGRVRATPYAQSKHEADLWLDSQPGGIRRLTIHPCYLLDTWDSRPSSGAILFALRLGKLSEYVNTQKNFVAARDVARTLLAGLELGKTGHFVVGGENLPLKEFFAIACDELRVSPELRELPSLAALQDPLAREFCSSGPIDDSRARRELGHQPSLDTRQLVREAIDYFQRMKMLRLQKQGKS